jgi:hypothetical protein
MIAGKALAISPLAMLVAFFFGALIPDHAKPKMRPSDS